MSEQEFEETVGAVGAAASAAAGGAADAAGGAGAAAGGGRQVDPIALVEAAVAGDRVSLGRVLSLVERAGDAASTIDRHVRSSWPELVIGVTGPPGAGKSTLTDCMVGALRGAGHRVAVLAVDPTSPVSGGAILGDRVRMGGHAIDDNVIIRSLATRGASGGLAATVPAVIRVLAAAGFGTVVLETVGVGQVELDVAAVADTVLVVVTPAGGDEIQAVKAGIVEIASVFVVNKADLDGAAQAEADLLAAMSLRGVGDQFSPAWVPPVVRTVARTGEGVEALLEQVAAHAAWSEAGGHRAFRRQSRQREELERRVESWFLTAARNLIGTEEFAEAVKRVVGGQLSIADAADELLGPPPR